MKAALLDLLAGEPHGVLRVTLRLSISRWTPTASAA